MLTLAVMVLTAAQSWASYQVSAEAGGGTLSVTGLEAFPAAGTLISLQFLTVIAGLLIRNLFLRIVAGVLIPVMSWNFVDVFVNANDQVQLTATRILADQTGILQGPGSSEFLLASSNNLFSWGYLAALVLNILTLMLVTLFPTKPKKYTFSAKTENSPEDFWSNQR